MPNTAHKRNDLTAHQIETMSGLGMNMPMIESLTGISIPTIYKYYQAELAAGKAKTNLGVAKRIYELATGKDVPPAVQLNAAMFWMKTQAGWKEGMDININGEINHNSHIQINFISTDGTQQKGNQIPAKRAVPRKEIGYQNGAAWEPTFIGEHHETVN